MSDDSANMPKQTQDARKKVFVIKAKPNGLKSAENFLKNRTWELVSAHEMKIALATLFRHNVDYAMIGVDHPHAHVLKLPDIIAQTIKIPVILFAENMTPQAANVLRTSRHPYVLFPPVSGPAIERMLLRIEKDRSQLLQRSSDTRISDALAADSTEIRISSGAGAFEHSQMNGSFSEEDIAKLFEGDGLSPMLSATQDGVSSDMMTGYQKGASSHSISEEQEGGSSHSLSEMQAGHGSADPMSEMQKGHGSSHAMSEMQKGNGSSQAMSETQHAQPAAPTSKSSSLRKGSTIDLSLWPGNVKPPIPSKDKSQAPSGNDSFTPKVEDAGGYDRQVRHKSLMENGAEMALEKAAVKAPTDATPVATISTKSTSVGCFAVQSDGVSGVIVVAYGNDRIVDRKFANDLQDHLLIFMKENGIDFKIADIMNLKIEQVEFEEWSEREAVFLRKSIHAGCELALGFFINTSPKGRLETSTEKHMLKMSIDEIRVDHSLEFDVYLYLPQNGKYIRYAGKSGNMSGQQRDRLTKKGVTELHVKKEAESEISRYRMKNFLNDKISHYNKKAS